MHEFNQVLRAADQEHGFESYTPPLPAQPSGRGVADWQLNIIMEYCNAGSLFGVLRRQQSKGGRSAGYFTCQADFPFILSIASDIASGCTYIHSKQIIHGDLKPDNVLLKGVVPTAGQQMPPGSCVAKVWSY